MAACVTGAAMPAYAVLFGEVMGILADPVESARDDSVMYSLLFVGIGVIVGLAYFFQTFLFTYGGEMLTQRMRRKAFAAMMEQEIGFFDDPSNSTGALCSRYAGIAQLFFSDLYDTSLKNEIRDL